MFRKINSWAATVLARPFAGKVNDPMSGFFALDRSTFDRAERLTPLGYKIALELMCKCRVKDVRDFLPFKSYKLLDSALLRIEESGRTQLDGIPPQQ